MNDAKAARRFLRDLFAQLRATLGAGYRLEFRMDGAFFRRDIIARLERAGAEYAIKVPFYPWLGLKARVQTTRSGRGSRRVELRGARRDAGPWERRSASSCTAARSST